MPAYHVKPVTEGSAATIWWGYREKEQHVCPHEPCRAGWRGHRAAINPLRARLAVATQRACTLPHGVWGPAGHLRRSHHMGHPKRSNWARKGWISVEADPTPETLLSSGRDSTGRREDGVPHSWGCFLQTEPAPRDPARHASSRRPFLALRVRAEAASPNACAGSPAGRRHHTNAHGSVSGKRNRQTHVWPASCPVADE